MLAAAPILADRKADLRAKISLLQVFYYFRQENASFPTYSTNLLLFDIFY